MIKKNKLGKEVARFGNHKVREVRSYKDGKITGATFGVFLGKKKVSKTDMSYSEACNMAQKLNK